VGGYAESVRERVRAARGALAAAQAADDAYATAVAEDELDDAVRVARNVGVDPRSGTAAESGNGAA
jgi:hypothetical protein